MVIKKLKISKGFTLIELLVVVAIIGILAAVGVVAYNGYTASAKEKVCVNNFKLWSKLIKEKYTWGIGKMAYLLVGAFFTLAYIYGLRGRRRHS